MKTKPSEAVLVALPAWVPLTRKLTTRLCRPPVADLMDIKSIPI